MKYMTLIFVTIVSINFAGCASKAITQEDIQQLEEVKSLFVSQIKDDMHPVIWAYLDEVLHDPDSFRLQRFEYKISSFTYSKKFERNPYLLSDETEIVYSNVTAPAYRILMRYRVRVPAGGMMLKEQYFYLLKNKSLHLPNGQFVSLIDQSSLDDSP